MKRFQKNNFKNFFASETNGETHFCFRSGLTVYEEVYKGSRYMSAGWNTAGFTLNVLEQMPTWLNNANFTEAHSFDIEADGVSLSWDMEFVGYDESAETLENGTEVIHVKVYLKSRLKPLSVTVHTVLDGTDVFSRWVEAKNEGSLPMNINVASPMCGGIELIPMWKDLMDGAPDPARLYSLGYMSNSAHNHEGHFTWKKLEAGISAIDGKYLFDCYRHPMFLLRNNVLGKTMICQLGWTGGYRFEFVLNTETSNKTAPISRLSFRVDLKGQNPITVLGAGETFETPKIHIGMLAGDLDEAVNAMHSHLRRSVFTIAPARGVRGWIVGGMGPERIMDVKASKHFMDTIAAVGGETFITDAGWYCPLGTERMEWSTRVGDWKPDAETYPNGIDEIREYAHSKGLLFGLWIEPERIGHLSEAYKEHPDWLAKPYAGEEVSHKTLLDLAIPEACAWAEEQVARVIEDYKVDLFRLDYNVGRQARQNKYIGANGIENHFYKYYENVTAMYERLKRRFPDVVFENCSGGGGRTDVNFVKNFTHTWVSDCAVAPRSFAITNGMTMALPPEYVDRLLSGMGSHDTASLAWHARNTIFGRPTTNDYNTIGSEMNPEQIEIVKHTFDIYKKHVRPYIDDSLIFHHTPTLTTDPGASASAISEESRGVGIIERSSCDGRHGIVGIFGLANAIEDPTRTVYPKGIDPSLTYNVTLDNYGTAFEMKGYEILNTGIRINLSASLTSELIVYEAK